MYKRQVYGNRTVGEEEKAELFSFIEAPDSFGAVYEDYEDSKARRAYLRAFFYGLRKYMPKREYEAMCTSLAAGERRYKFLSRTAELIQAHAGQFSRVKQAYPWENAAEFEKAFFCGLRRILAFRTADRIRSKKYRSLHPVSYTHLRCAVRRYPPRPSIYSCS